MGQAWGRYASGSASAADGSGIAETGKEIAVDGTRPASSSAAVAVSDPSEIHHPDLDPATTGVIQDGDAAATDAPSVVHWPALGAGGAAAGEVPSSTGDGDGEASIAEAPMGLLHPELLMLQPLQPLQPFQASASFHTSKGLEPLSFPDGCRAAVDLQQEISVFVASEAEADLPSGNGSAATSLPSPLKLKLHVSTR
jgi:hypothetical protein